MSFGARCVPIDEEERPRSAGSTVSFEVRPASPASVVSEDIEADATWCGNWRSRRAAQEPEDEMDVTSLRTALAWRGAMPPRREPTPPRRGHARRRAGAARADALAAPKISARRGRGLRCRGQGTAAAAARDASRARSNQAAAEAARGGSAQLRRARDGEVFVDALDALEAFDDVPPPPKPPPPLTPETALTACERAFLPQKLQPLSLDALADLDRRVQHLGDELKRQVVDRARCGDEASQCALCCSASKSVAFVDCGRRRLRRVRRARRPVPFL